MEVEESSTVSKKRRWILGAILGVVFVVVAIGIIVGVTLHLVRSPTQTFRAVFIDRCEKFVGKNKMDCQHLFANFEQAYVGKPSCNVSMGAYDPLIAGLPFEHPCNTTMLWSKTKDLVRKYTESKTSCFILRDTLLGSVLDGLTWCGEEGSNETITTDCPGRHICENNPVSSFWSRASAAFADYACENVTAMLNGSVAKPFDPNSAFGKTELLELKHPKVTYLNVILVTGHNYVSNCSSQNLQDIRHTLDSKIEYTCREVPESQIKECIISKTYKGCGACLVDGD